MAKSVLIFFLVSFERLDFRLQENFVAVLFLDLDPHHVRFRQVCGAVQLSCVGFAKFRLHGPFVVVLVQPGVVPPLRDGVLHRPQTLQQGIDQTPVVGMGQGDFVEIRDLELSHPPVGGKG